MADASRNVSSPTIDEQIAAVEECIVIARGVMNNAIGGVPAFASLRYAYQQRVVRLEAAAATLRATRLGEP